MLDRRTITVLGSLVAGMTLTSGLLKFLEPGPVAPLTSTVLLRTEARSESSEQRLFDVPQDRTWQGIVIHDSGALYGSARSINKLHESIGRGGLGYHFVLNNGNGARDGEIEIGFRWKRQMVGAYVEGPGAESFNRHAIGVCLVGDADRKAFTQAQLKQLTWLVQQLQTKYGIPKEAVFVDVGSTGTPAATFPHAWFRQQLLTPSGR